MKRNWLEDLQEKMQDHEFPVSTDSWQNLEDKLFPSIQPNSQSTPLGREVKRPVGKRVAIYALVASVAGLLVCGVYFLGVMTDMPSSKLQSSTDSPVSQRAEIEMQVSKSVKVSQTQKIGANNLKSSPSRTMNPSFEVNNVRIWESLSEIGNRSEFSQRMLAQVVSSPVESNFTNALAVMGVRDVVLPFVETSVSDTQIKQRPAKSALEGFSLSPFAGQLASNSSMQNPGYMTLQEGSTLRGSMPQLDSPYVNVLMGNSTKEAKTQVNHQTPIKYGLKVQYPLDKKWSLSSGLNYINLRSDLKAGTEQNYWESRQSLHYIGLPLHINYKLMQSSKLATYAYFGGEVKKMVSATTRTKYVVTEEPTTYSTEKLHEKALQVSLNSGIGLEYKLFKNVGLYVEPGIEYHLKSNSEIQSLYKDRPLNISLNSGLRFVIPSSQ